jgi:hypothetical protein
MKKFVNFFFLALCVSAASLRADDWSLTTSDFESQPAQLKGFSAAGAVISSSETKTDRTIQLDQFVSIQRLATDQPATPRYTLLLSGGDHLAGEPAGVSGEKLTWSNAVLGKIPISFNRLVMIGKGDSATPPAEPPKQDIVTLANGDTAAGVFSGIDNAAVTLQADSGPTTLPLASVTRIAFAATGPVKQTSTRAAPAFRIHLTDGSVLTVAEAVLQADQITLTLPGKNAPAISIPVANVLGIEQINGPVSWLSSHVPVENRQTPYLGGEQAWPARFDLAVDGLPLSFENQSFDRGIGVHAYSELTFDIDPQWMAFRTQYAIESHRDNPARFADVVVRIKLDGKVVHEQTHFKSGVLSPVVMINLKGSSKLTLECDFGDAGDTQARLNWLQPALLRELPGSAATTAPAGQ